jgi:hypothetical protein
MKQGTSTKKGYVQERYIVNIIRNRKTGRIYTLEKRRIL